MTASINWVVCDGGPHILMERRLADSWEGSNPPSNGRVVKAVFRFAGEGSPATDYDAACDVDGFAGIIPVGDGVAVVFDDEVPMSAWIPGDQSPCLVIPMEWNEVFDDDDIVRAVLSTPPETFEDTGLIYENASADLFHFAACDFPPDWAYPSIAVTIEPGKYRIWAANKIEFADGWLRAYKFVCHC